jgi:hypothetical protein
MMNALRRLRSTALPALAAAGLLAASARAQTLPTGINATPVGVSSVTVSWFGDTMTVYQVVDSTDSPISSTTTALTAYAETIVGYSTNSLVSFMVEASSAGFVVDSATQTVYTQAAQPSASALVGTNVNQTTLEWSANGNPPGTYYNVEWSIASSTPIVLSTAPAVIIGTATATISELPGGQTVNFQVQAVNFAGLQTPFDVTLSTTIVSIGGQAAISSGTYALGFSSISWSWTASTGAINYQLFEDSGVAASPLLGPNQLSYAQTGLSPNTLYQDYIVSYGLTSSTQSASYGWYTLAAPTTGLMVISSSPASVTATLSWGANGNPPNTTYDVEWWTRLTSTVTVSTQATTAVLTNLYGGSTVYFTIQAVNNNGLIGGYDTTIGSPPSVLFSTSVLNVPANTQGSLTFVLPTASVNVQFSSSTFTSGAYLTVVQASTASIFPPPATPPNVEPISVGASGSPILFQIMATNGSGVTVTPTTVLTISVYYNPALINGVVPESLSINYDDPVHGWVALATSKGSNDDLHAVSSNAGYFQIFGIAAPSDLSEITVGPNPLRPIVNPGQLMTFRNLPKGTRVRIFTYLGEKLADIASDDSGIAAWDGRNAHGSYVASGVYIAVIQGAGVKKTMRVAIER